MMLALASLVLGVLASYAAGRYFQALANRRAYAAAAWDMALLTLNAMPMVALWAADSWLSIVGWIIGNGIGTIVVARCR